jgi:hypothetical protein
MTPRPASAPSGITIETFLEDHVFRSRHSTFPIVADGRAVGLATLSRVKEVPRDRRATSPIDSAACPFDEVPVVGPDKPLEALLTKMSTCTDGQYRWWTTASSSASSRPPTSCASSSRGRCATPRNSLAPL